LINAIVTKKAKLEFARLMKFENGGLSITASGALKKLPLLYIHIPFCEKLCPYCSFHRVVFDSALCRDYFQALRKEITLYKAGAAMFFHSANIRRDKPEPSDRCNYLRSEASRHKPAFRRSPKF
jgi:coproporphyrinogen III oxidase-like Fe-S oxidoreductase